METKQELLDKGQKLTEQFKELHSVDPTKIGGLYDKMDPEEYEAMLKAINFTEPDFICKCIYNSQEKGGLALSKDSCIYDMGCGTGIIGVALAEQGYKNLYGTDASGKFVESSQAKGCYKEVK